MAPSSNLYTPAMKLDIVVDEFKKLCEKDYKVARKFLKKFNYKNNHRLLQLIALSYVDEASFYANGMKKEYYDRRCLRYAETYIVKAFKIRPICSNVLWTLAKVRKDYQQYDSAIFCFQEIIRLGVKGICRDSCKNERDTALAQINDSKFELYRLYYNSNPTLSKRYFTMYKNGVRKGINTLYIPLDEYILT